MWLDAVINPQAIASLYDDPTAFDKARLHRISLNEADPIAVLHVTISETPSRRPIRWAAKVNATVVELNLVGISSIILSAWTPANPPRFTMMKGSDGLVVLESEDQSFRAICEFVYVMTVHGYCRG